MKKKVIALATLGALAGSPNAHAQIDSTKVDTEKDLVEAVSPQDISSENGENAISFEDAKRMQEKQEMKEAMMNNEEIQELIKKYGKEKVEKMMDDILKDDNLENFIEDFLTDDEMLKSLEKGDDVDITEKIGKYFSHLTEDPNLLECLLIYFIMGTIFILMSIIVYGFITGVQFIIDLCGGHFLPKYIIKIKKGRIYMSMRELTDEQREKYDSELGEILWVSKDSKWLWGKKLSTNRGSLSNFGSGEGPVYTLGDAIREGRKASNRGPGEHPQTLGDAIRKGRDVLGNR